MTCIVAPVSNIHMLSSSTVVVSASSEIMAIASSSSPSPLGAGLSFSSLFSLMIFLIIDSNASSVRSEDEFSSLS